MHPSEIVAIELLAEARLDLIAASFLQRRWPSVSGKLIDLAAQALALRAQWESAPGEDTQGTSQTSTPPPMELG